MSYNAPAIQRDYEVSLSACKPSASLAMSALSCPAQAGHPVITDSPVVTGSPAFAGDDDEEANQPTKIIAR
jgi:hypothetical protein